ncbi:probable leucine-rich repeat receptor-like serine/threonine-protein kinase At3g14840 [Cryptomeria japonica]|uniref:probable leucine-rich repeat receptor-like serine/threonine-protein kinase At3g14840 n=1 Tax=Cryptomeria japonica TaxID=3369 RepID=UPI0027DA8F81|nr:probable leucine-rich repeat receptor-like serine/threonine-protein kinase At3g14840 [Cryptomeria japonica]
MADSEVHVDCGMEFPVVLREIMFQKAKESEQNLQEEEVCGLRTVPNGMTLSLDSTERKAVKILPALLFENFSTKSNSNTAVHVEALKVIASKMKISNWDFSLDPCKNDDSNWYTLDDALGPRGVMCNCEFEKNTTCHAVKLIVVYEELIGIIPPELANLTYLQSIDLRFNYLSGSIPATIGSLSRLEYMSLVQNRLTGQIPKELGNLTKLISLSFEMNSLSGTLPPELGKLTNLERLSMSRLKGDGLYKKLKMATLLEGQKQLQ